MAGTNYFSMLLSSVVAINLFSNSKSIDLDGEFSYTTNGDRPVVMIEDGVLQGFIMRTVYGRKIAAFRSIPYAEPPVGPLRFRNPVKNKRWTGIRDALPESPQCIQADLVKSFEVHGQEDCLYLNVYVPLVHLQYSNRTHLLPVMVWINGGAFFFGAGSLFGPRYLLDQEIILVTLNFRQGPFGFFSTGDAASPGNQGLKDQVFALQWVQKNIPAFGGNPKSVTLFGVSSGATSVGLHVVSPLSRGLFHRVICESGSAFVFWAVLPKPLITVQRVAEQFNCSIHSNLEMVECLRNVPAESLAPIQLQLTKWSIYPLLVFVPSLEPTLPGAFITKSVEQYYADGEAADVTMMTGFTTNEMTYVISAMIQNSVAVSDVNRDWDRFVPILLGLDYTSTEISNARARAIRRFYMDDKEFDWNTRFNFSRIYSARYIVDGSLKAIRYHSMHTKKPVYAYLFSYQGRYSNVQQFGQKTEDWGVSHMDELIYLLNNTDYYGTLETDNKKDLQMSSILTRIWTHFATHDNPNVKVVSGADGYDQNAVLAPTWYPITPAKNIFSPLQFYDLNLQSKMITDPYVKEYLFWRLVINPNP